MLCGSHKWEKAIKWHRIPNFTNYFWKSLIFIIFKVHQYTWHKDGRQTASGLENYGVIKVCGETGQCTSSLNLIEMCSVINHGYKTACLRIWQGRIHRFVPPRIRKYILTCTANTQIYRRKKKLNISLRILL